MAERFFLDVSPKLLHVVELEGELALLVSSVVLVEQVLCNSLVEHLNSFGVASGCSSLVAGFNSSEELLDGGLQLALEHLVLQGLGFDYFYALLSGLNVRHWIFLPIFINLYGMTAEQSLSAPERVRRLTVSYSMVLYHFFSSNARGIRKIPGKITAKFHTPET